MTDEQILKAVVEKAEKNGWDTTIGFTPLSSPQQDAGLSVEAVIYNKDFAKAFWGAGMNLGTAACECPTCALKLSNWQHHLQQMVLEEEPLQYLKQFLTEG